jgi:hypothetical protein
MPHCIVKLQKKKKKKKKKWKQKGNKKHGGWKKKDLPYLWDWKNSEDVNCDCEVQLQTPLYFLPRLLINLI